MATDKLFNVIGISKLAGEYKVRFANDIMRIKVLAKHGHEDIRLVELDTPLTKLEAVKLMKSMDEFSDVTSQAAIADYLDRKDEKPAKAKAPAKAPKAASKAKATKTAGPVASKAKKAAKQDENAPFDIASAEDALM
jgi:hypothetical protein